MRLLSVCTNRSNSKVSVKIWVLIFRAEEPVGDVLKAKLTGEFNMFLPW
jgi:hypothetical protein